MKLIKYDMINTNNTNTIDSNIPNTDQNSINRSNYKETNPDKPFLIPPMLESPHVALKHFPSPNKHYKERDQSS